MVSQGLCWQVSTSKAPKKVAPPPFPTQDLSVGIY